MVTNHDLTGSFLMLEYTESKQLKVKEGRKRVGHANSAMFPFSQELLLSKIPWEFLHDNSGESTGR